MTDPRVWVYCICRNEAQMMPYFLRHYQTFAQRIVVFDEQSNDGTREILRGCPKVELRDWPHRGLDDQKFMAKVNSVAQECRHRCDWMMFVDVDELLYHPHPLQMLRFSAEGAVASTGYALISPDGWPEDDGRQLYEQVRTGAPQPNYGKFVCWRPALEMEHTVGRHTCPGFPRFGGKLGSVSRFKLLHCHHLGGVDHTLMRNARNYHHAVNKGFAWNYTPAFDRPEQVGTLSWVTDLVENNKLIDVMAL